jgi:uncharacterized membrane protein
METSPHKSHDKAQFQLERLILFSDAVFAIAITLLIIEIKVPHFENKATEHDISQALAHQIPEWIGFFISFWVIGIYWMSHHRMFGYLVRHNEGLALLNLLFLMTIVIMPFSSALYSNFPYLNTSFVFYCLNVVATGLCLQLLWRYINNPAHKISEPIPSEIRQRAYVRNAVAPAIFLLAALMPTLIPGPVGGMVSRLMFFLIFPIQMILGRLYRPKPEVVPSEERS